MSEEKRTRKGVSMGAVTVCSVVEEGEGTGAWVPQEIPFESVAAAGKWLKEGAAEGKYAVVRLVGIQTVAVETTTIRRVS